MTYRVDCGGEKFFRDRDAQCGEDAVRDCTCKGTQNSHAKLLTKFGPGTLTTDATDDRDHRARRTARRS